MKRASRVVATALFTIACLSCGGEEPPPSVPQLPAVDSSARLAVAPAPPPPELRLPETVKPVRYDLDLNLRPSKDTFSGRIAIDLDVISPTSVIWLNATNLTVKAAKLQLGANTNNVIDARIVPGGEDFVGFQFDGAIAAGRARLAIDYEGLVDKDRSLAIYRQQEPGGGDYIYTFFEPIDARRAFPCFDEPSYKVPWKLTLHVPKNDVALGNSPVTAEKAEADDMKAVELAETKPLPSYLIAFVVGPFDVVDAGLAGHNATKLRFIVPKGRRDETRYAAEVTPKIIGFLEDYFGMPYPFEKLDVAVVPRFWGTMEHPGIVALGQPLTLIKQAEETTQRKQAYANIATHELAHYWFGDYVTTAWWDDIWLNESLAQWMDAKITDQIDPSWKFGLERVDRAGSAMANDGLASAKKTREPILSKHDIADSFDAESTYNKGASVVSMFESFMTPEKLQKAIRGYMTKHAWGNAKSDDLLAALEAEGGVEIATGMRTFLDQPGVPIVNADVDCKGAPKIMLKQRRYLPLGSKAQALTWKFPVCVRYGKGKESGRACTMMASETAELPLATKTCPAWVLGNENAMGYYHVAYTRPMLKALLQKGGPELSLAERLGVMRDAAALVASGDLTVGEALEHAPAALASDDRRLVFAGLELVGLLRGPTLPDEQHKKMARWLRKVIAPRAKKLGWTPKPKEDHDAELLRPSMIGLAAIGAEDPDLRKEAKKLAEKWLTDKTAIAPDLVGTALAAAARSNDKALFDALVSAAKKTYDHRDKGRIFNSLAGFTDPEIVKRAQALVLAPDLDIRDTSNIIFFQLGERETREDAWAFLKASFETLASRMRADEAMYLFAAPAVFCDQKHLDDARAFLEPRAAKFEGAPLYLKSTLESIGLCILMQEKNKASIEAFLKPF